MELKDKYCSFIGYDKKKKDYLHELCIKIELSDDDFHDSFLENEKFNKNLNKILKGFKY